MVFEPHTVGLADGRRVVVRPAAPDDAGAIVAYLAALSRTTDQIVTQADEVSGPEAVRARIERVSPERGELWLVVEPEGSSGVVGAAGGELVADCVLRVPERRKLAHNATIGMGVAEGWRGVALGRGLLGSAVAWGRGHPRLERLELSVLHTNRAGVRLYAGLGFVEEGRQRGRIRQAEGVYADEVLMALRVGG